MKKLTHTGDIIALLLALSAAAVALLIRFVDLEASTTLIMMAFFGLLAVRYQTLQYVKTVRCAWDAVHDATLLAKTRKGGAHDQ